jgi:hypothetical protein
MFMYLFRIYLIAILISLFSLSVYAVSGADMLKRCEGMLKEMQNPSAPASHNTWWCMGYVKGFHDSHTYSSIKAGELQGKQRVTNAEGIVYCPRIGVTYDQLAVIIINYLKSNPNLLHHDVQILAGQALANAFPCQGR